MLRRSGDDRWKEVLGAQVRHLEQWSGALCHGLRFLALRGPQNIELVQKDFGRRFQNPEIPLAGLRPFPNKNIEHGPRKTLRYRRNSKSRVVQATERQKT